MTIKEFQAKWPCTCKPSPPEACVISRGQMPAVLAWAKENGLEWADWSQNPRDGDPFRVGDCNAFGVIERGSDVELTHLQLAGGNRANILALVQQYNSERNIIVTYPLPLLQMILKLSCHPKIDPMEF